MGSKIFKFWENVDYEHKMFFLFVFIHFIVWIAVAMIRVVMQTDALECIYWGALHDFGTPKHPPLAGWLAYYTFSLFKTDLSIYILSQSFILLGMIYIYKLAKKIFDKKRAMLSVILLEGCWVYSYIIGYYGFNPDVILLGLLPVITYYFYKCMFENKPSNWVALGIFTGISFLNKYQTVLILLAMFIWALIYRRSVFKSKWFYISVIIAFLIFSPHLLWMIKYDFFPLLYFEEELNDSGWLYHILNTFVFTIVQISVMLGSIVMFALLKWKQKSSFKVITIDKDEKTWFLILLAFIPFLVHFCMGLFTGGTMRPRWGFEFLYMTGIMLFYFFPTKDITKQDFNFVLKFAYLAMLITFIVMGTLLSVEKNYRSRYPVKVIHNDLIEFWGEAQKRPLKYLGGYIEWTLPLSIYGSSHPKIILDTNGYKNPWIDEDDLKKSGILIIGRTVDEIEHYTKLSCPYLEEDYEINPVEYRFTVTNAYNKAREYQIYYYIVPPME